MLKPSFVDYSDFRPPDDIDWRRVRARILQDPLMCKFKSAGNRQNSAITLWGEKKKRETSFLFEREEALTKPCQCAGLDRYMCHFVACCSGGHGEARYERQDVFRTVFGNRSIHAKDKGAKGQKSL
jgi:hypothetical protein